MTNERSGTPNDVIRQTDDNARMLGRRLLRSSRHAALGFIDPQDGFPSVSRVLTATDIDGAPVLLVSSLSAHTKGLAADPHASLLFGEVGKGDPLAHPRLTVHGISEQIVKDGEVYSRVRRRFLARHPKSSLYIDFPDFAILRLAISTTRLNAGFGRAYVLSADDLMIRSPATSDLAALEEEAVAHMNFDHADAIALCATRLAGEKPGNWRMAGVDAAGIDLLDRDRLCRLEFDEVLTRAAGLRPALMEMTRRARALG